MVVAVAVSLICPDEVRLVARPGLVVRLVNLKIQ
jgi:hypothetical protein